MVNSIETHVLGENRLLASLPKRERDCLLPNLQPVTLRFDEVLYEPDGLIRYIYFPTSSMVSLLLVLEDGTISEVGRVGNEGLIGLPVFLGENTSRTRAFVQIPGEALRMKAQVFRQSCQAGPLATLLLRYTQALMNHFSQVTACNNRHSIQQRLCRWLLITHDRIQADQFELTQEFLSQMLGTHRESITVVAGALQKSGVIRYSRGKLTILDRRGLEAASCECYWAINKAYEQLFA
jgi:CRP-like cAMP-binding protein